MSDLRTYAQRPALALALLLSTGCGFDSASTDDLSALQSPGPGQLTTYSRQNGVYHHGGGQVFFAAVTGPVDLPFRENGDEVLSAIEANGPDTLLLALLSDSAQHEASHPFAASEDGSSVDSEWLKQWHVLLQRLESSGVDVLLSFYGNSDLEIPPDLEEIYVASVVTHFKNLKNIAWVVPDGLGDQRTWNILSVVRQHDDRGHPLVVPASYEGPALPDTATLIRLTRIDGARSQAFYRTALETRASADEARLPLVRTSVDFEEVSRLRRAAWSTAMAGVPFVIDAAGSDISDLGFLRTLQNFFEADLPYSFRPTEDLALSGNQFVLSDRLHGRYLIWTPDAAQSTDGKLGIDGEQEQAYELTWLDPVSGESVREKRSGFGRFSPPKRMTGEIALRMIRVPDPRLVYPGEAWPSMSLAQAGLSASAARQLAEEVQGDGCIVRYGHMTFCWGNPRRKADWASAAKPVVNSMIHIASARGDITGVHEPIAAAGWGLTDKDRAITLHHLMNMVSGYGRGEEAGAAWAYNDHAVRLYMLTFERLAGRSVSDLSEDYFSPLGIEQPPIFGSREGLGLKASIPDVARIALWWSHFGRWPDAEIVEQPPMTEFMSPAVSSSVPISRRKGETYLDLGSFGGGTNQTRMGPGYFGNGWWFNSPTYFSSEGVAWPGLPADAFMASGHWGKELVAIFPSLELIVLWRSDLEWEEHHWEMRNPDSKISRVFADLLKTAR